VACFASFSKNLATATILSTEICYEVARLMMKTLYQTPKIKIPPWVAKYKRTPS
jgi:hypothetical protein